MGRPFLFTAKFASVIRNTSRRLFPPCKPTPAATYNPHPGVAFRHSAQNRPSIHSLCDNPISLLQHVGAFDFPSTPQAREKWKEVMAMAPELNWTSIAETFIKSLFGYLSKKRKSRRSNGDHASK